MLAELLLTALRRSISILIRIRSLYAIRHMWLISPAGIPVPLSEIADLPEGATYATLRRVDRERTATVTASVASNVSPEEIVASIRPKLDKLKAKYPQLTVEFAGRQEQMADAFASLPYGFLAAILMIYVILAWLFSSYFQPLFVLLAVPFGLHALLVHQARLAGPAVVGVHRGPCARLQVQEFGWARLGLI